MPMWRISGEPADAAIRSPSRIARSIMSKAGAERPLGVVFMRDRRAEQGKQCIADELVDEAAETLHRRGQFFEQLVLEALQGFGVELLAQRGEAAKVGK